MNGFDVGIAMPQSYPGTDGSRAIALQQESNFFGDRRIGALTANSPSMFVVHGLRSIHRNRKAESMRIKPTDQFLIKERRIRSEREINLFAVFLTQRFSIRHHVSNQGQVRKRLAPEKDHIELFALFPCGEQQIDAPCCGDKIHPLALARNGKVFFVAVSAMQVASRVDVENHCRQRSILQLGGGGIDRPQRIFWLEDF